MRVLDETFRRVLLLTAHADDAEFFAGGALARLADSGAEITEIIATDNGRGSFDLDQATLIAQSREVEAREAAKIIGKKQVEFLGYPDGFLDETPKNELRRIYMEWIRRVRPDLVMSFDAFAPFESHPDHRHVAVAAMEAVAFAHMPLFHPEQIRAGLAPHLVATCYWFAKHPERANGAVDIASTLNRKIDALCVQPSQMRLTIQDLKLALTVTGRHPELLPLLDETPYPPLIAHHVSAWSAAQGARAGLPFAELFRVQSAAQLFDDTAL